MSLWDAVKKFGPGAATIWALPSGIREPLEIAALAGKVNPEDFSPSNFLDHLTTLLDERIQRLTTFRVLGHVDPITAQYPTDFTLNFGTNSTLPIGIPGISAGGRPVLSDATGGLFSMLATDLAELHKTEETQAYLSDVIKNGSYLDAKRDEIIATLSVIPTDMDPRSHLHTITARFLDGDQLNAPTLNALVVQLFEDDIHAAVLENLARLPVSDDKQFDRVRAAQRIALTQTGALTLPRGRIRPIVIEIGISSELPDPWQYIQRVEVTVCRQNRFLIEELFGFTAVPAKDDHAEPIKTKLLLDLSDYRSVTVPLDNQHPFHAVGETAESLPTTRDGATQADKQVVGGAWLPDFILEKARHRIELESQILGLRSMLKAIEPRPDEFDYRLRYQLCLANLGKQATQVDTLSMDRGSTQSPWQSTSLTGIQLPARAVYRTTINPRPSLSEDAPAQNLIAVKASPQQGSPLFVSLAGGFAGKMAAIRGDVLEFPGTLINLAWNVSDAHRQL